MKISETEMDKSESESDPGGVTRTDEDNVEDKLGESLLIGQLRSAVTFSLLMKMYAMNLSIF